MLDSCSLSHPETIGKQLKIPYLLAFKLLSCTGPTDPCRYSSMLDP